MTGFYRFNFFCMMGCSYPAIFYQSNSTSFERAANEFQGTLTNTDLTSPGTFSGRFAGPGAEELIISFNTPFFDPDRQVVVGLSGVALARRVP